MISEVRMIHKALRANMATFGASILCLFSTLAKVELEANVTIVRGTCIAL